MEAQNNKSALFEKYLAQSQTAETVADETSVAPSMNVETPPLAPVQPPVEPMPQYQEPEANLNVTIPVPDLMRGNDYSQEDFSSNMTTAVPNLQEGQEFGVEDFTQQPVLVPTQDPFSSEQYIQEQEQEQYNANQTSPVDRIHNELFSEIGLPPKDKVHSNTNSAETQPTAAKTPVDNAKKQGEKSKKGAGHIVKIIFLVLFYIFAVGYFYIIAADFFPEVPRPEFVQTALEQFDKLF
ncbi:MAG: hypothetical protein LBQ41_02075 [Candidatus Ancillula sp.]|nr:hypothetical protein [Candidatus Ancillula sp.]